MADVLDISFDEDHVDPSTVAVKPAEESIVIEEEVSSVIVELEQPTASAAPITLSTIPAPAPASKEVATFPSADDQPRILSIADLPSPIDSRPTTADAQRANRCAGTADDATEYGDDFVSLVSPTIATGSASAQSMHATNSATFDDVTEPVTAASTPQPVDVPTPAALAPVATVQMAAAVTNDSTLPEVVSSSLAATDASSEPASVLPADIKQQLAPTTPPTIRSILKSPSVTSTPSQPALVQQIAAAPLTLSATMPLSYSHHITAAASKQRDTVNDFLTAHGLAHCTQPAVTQQVSTIKQETKALNELLQYNHSLRTADGKSAANGGATSNNVVTDPYTGASTLR